MKQMKNAVLVIANNNSMRRVPVGPIGEEDRIMQFEEDTAMNTSTAPPAPTVTVRVKYSPSPTIVASKLLNTALIAWGCFHYGGIGWVVAYALLLAFLRYGEVQFDDIKAKYQH